MELIITTSPILVSVPDTGQPVNVSPFFDAMHQFDGDNSPQSLRQAIIRVTRHINLKGGDDSVELASINFDLYRLEDMFTAMMNIDQSAESIQVEAPIPEAQAPQ